MCCPGLQIAFKCAGYVKTKYFTWVFNWASWFVPVNLGSCLKNLMQLLNRNWAGEKGESQSKPWDCEAYHAIPLPWGQNSCQRFFLQSSQVERPEKAMKENKHQPWLSPFNRRFNWYRPEVNFQSLSRPTACHRWLHGFTTIIVQLLKEKKIFAVMLLEWRFWKHSVMNPFSHDSISHWLLTSCSEKWKLRVHWRSVNSKKNKPYWAKP